MSEEEEKNRGFKVDDRRRFSAEGELKPELQDEPEPQRKPQPQGKPEPQAPKSPPAAADDTIVKPSANAQAQASDAYRKASSLTNADAGPEDITFMSFVVGLSTEALALLGEMPHPTTGEVINDLGGAQQIIDILAILRDKTRGNLNHDEQGLLDAILFELRMKYVEKARRASR